MCLARLSCQGGGSQLSTRAALLPEKPPLNPNVKVCKVCGWLHHSLPKEKDHKCFKQAVCFVLRAVKLLCVLCVCVLCLLCVFVFGCCVCLRVACVSVVLWQRRKTANSRHRVAKSPAANLPQRTQDITQTTMLLQQLRLCLNSSNHRKCCFAIKTK